MSRVTLKQLYRDMDNASKDDCRIIRDVEVVPRQLVEMIIKKCKDQTLGPQPRDYIVGVSNEANLIAAYAESLLMEFEDGNDTCDCID